MTESFVKRLLPKSLFGRSLLIIITPLVLLQVVSAFVFYESHWDKVSLRLARSLAGDIAAVTDLMRRYPGAENRVWIFELAAGKLGLEVSLRKEKILSGSPSDSGQTFDMPLSKALREAVRRPFRIDTESRARRVVVTLQLSEGVLEIAVPRKRLFSSTTYIFVLWMIGISLILFGVAVVFMRNQVKPIRRLAQAADDFGKGRDVPANFKPEGAAEVRKAASAFIAMRDRIKRQINERTEMLAGVSHDLRTPLTRMKLQMAIEDGTEGMAELKEDVDEMEHMLEGYLAFARGEGTEKPCPTNLNALLEEVASQARRKGGAVDLHCEGTLVLPLRPHGFKRCVTNLLDNAIRYADHVSLRAGRRGHAIEITIDDDGPGIPEDSREDVFKPFFRLEGSRNPETGGVGLGLSIARDLARSHGGDLELGAAPSGGLRARIRLPL